MSNFKKYMSIVEAMGALPPDLLVGKGGKGKLVTPENEREVYDEIVNKNTVLNTVQAFIKKEKNKDYINEITKTSGKKNYKGLSGEDILTAVMQSKQPLDEDGFQNFIYSLKEPQDFVNKVISYYMQKSNKELTEDEFSKTIKFMANI